MLQGRAGERSELHNNAGRQETGIERKVRATETGRATQRRGDIPDSGEMSHLLDRHFYQHAAPSLYGVGLLCGQAVNFAILQAEGCVEVGAHEIVLELGGLVEGMESVLARDLQCWSGYIIHRDRSPNPGPI